SHTNLVAAFLILISSHLNPTLTPALRDPKVDLKKILAGFSNWVCGGGGKVEQLGS
ncbi:unnamed protein product, partial [Prunus brigantina]